MQRGMGKMMLATLVSSKAKDHVLPPGREMLSAGEILQEACHEEDSNSSMTLWPPFHASFDGKVNKLERASESK